MYTLRAEGDSNPYAWDLDLCSVTLANFNYRTLSLVRDYDALAAEPRPNPAFDEMFSAAPRDVPGPGEAIPLAERYLVVPADGSQVTALSQARADDNFVIQGPPGTGKSQTITNLVADFVARGKRVLFVCQKRAALDVVHARLRAQGLDDICTLVHDSQQDKKAFVHGLRETYERWLAADEPLDAVEARRTSLIAEMSTGLDEVVAYEHALAATRSGVTVLTTLERLIALRSARWGDDLTPAEQRLLPPPGDWLAARPAVDAVVAALARGGGEPILARSPLRLLDPAVLHEPRADAAVAERAESARQAIDAVLAGLSAVAPAPDVEGLSEDHVTEIVAMHTVLGPLAHRGLGEVLVTAAPAAAQLRADRDQSLHLDQVAAAADQAAAGWREPLAADDARSALEVAQRRERSPLRLLNADWRHVRRLIATRFAAGDREMKPSATQALQLLVARYDTAAEVGAFAAQSRQRWGHADVAGLVRSIAAIRRHTGLLGRWRGRITGHEALDALDGLAGDLPAARAALAGLVAGTGELPLRQLGQELSALAGPAGRAQVRAAGPALRDLAQTPGGPAILPVLRRLAATPDQLEYAVVAASMRDARAGAPALDRVDGGRLADLLTAISERLPALQRANAEVVKARLRERFAESVAHSQRSVSGMNPADRDRKKTWATGRRELEHEFGKVKAYKSIRQLASGDAGAVVSAMRPVWLMSPPSLSDTLPLESVFDVVIFDEASQVPVEEAVPALYRGRQVIVVGDRMQLPPTQYFQARPPDSIAMDGATEESGSDRTDEAEAVQVGVVLDADSFLAVGSVRLPSTMLTWHYRSRSEALIQFSNAAFYDGRLATIPDRALNHVRARPLEYSIGERPDPRDVRESVDGLLDRSISYLRVLDGLYIQRTNPQEATWIAHLVREVLVRETGRTIGVVAFSEAQESEIERALERLSGEDPDFARRYEAELNREEDGQAIGLFVKNLENVQGDERDLIVMSVCYAAGPDGRMRMNFGPINNAGGEKRLNVIFSRSRHHMVVVSSIDHAAITNVYNDGANTLKNFLHYAESISNGDVAAAAGVLAGLRKREGSTQDAGGETPDRVPDSRGSPGARVRGDRQRGTVGVPLRPGDPAAGSGCLGDRDPRRPQSAAGRSASRRAAGHPTRRPRVGRVAGRAGTRHRVGIRAAAGRGANHLVTLSGRRGDYCRVWTCGWEPHRPSGDRRPCRHCCRTRW